MERYQTDDDDDFLSDESASLYTSDEHYFDDASDIQEDISSEGEESFSAQTRRRIIPSEILTCTAVPDFSASQAGMFQETCCIDYVIEALTLSPSDPSRGPAHLRAKHERLLGVIYGQQTPEQPQASTPFARESEWINKITEEKRWRFVWSSSSRSDCHGLS
ncbi:hypothetical protein E4U32_002559 [Claviceps aff. humidiphila group G2b]|nr:hypothetical protein E4U32_002559 [Claviceps aff. humidiphila group G2b]